MNDFYDLEEWVASERATSQALVAGREIYLCGIATEVLGRPITDPEADL